MDREEPGWPRRHRASLCSQFRVLVGSDAKMMDRFYRLNPRRAAGLIANQMKDLLGP